MKVNTNSWHYKMMRWYREPYDMPRTLCTYFWSVVLFGVLTLGCVGAGVVLLMAATSPVWGTITYYLFGYVAGLDLATFVTVAYIIVGLMWLYQYGYVPEKIEKSLPVEYMKAVKSKVCPMIEYVKE